MEVDEHRRVLDEVCARWTTRVAGSAGHGRAEAEQGVAEAYRAAGAEPPEVVVWLDSPVAGAVAAWTLRHGHRHPRPEERPQVRAAWAEAGAAPQAPPAMSGRDVDALTREAERRVGRATWPRIVDEITRRVDRPTWAMSADLVQQWRLRASGSGDPAQLARVYADVAARLADGLPPLLPGEPAADTVHAIVRDMILDAVRGAPHNGSRPADEQWQEIWDEARPPLDPVALYAVSSLTAAGAAVAAPVDALLRTAGSVGWWWAFGRVAVLTPPPSELHTDARGVPHRADGPAIRFADGLAHHLWHGHLVPDDLVVPGWSAADIVEASDEELQRRAARWLGADSHTARLPAGYVVPDLRRCALERLGWARFAAEAALAPVAGPVADPDDPEATLTLYDVPRAVFGRPARVVIRTGGTGDGAGLPVPADAADPATAAAWLGGADPEPAPDPEPLRRIREDPRLRDLMRHLDWDLDAVDHVEEVHLLSGARLEPIGGHGTGGTYFLCGDGPRRPVLYLDSEGGAEVLGRDLTEALELVVSADPDGGEPEEADEEAAEALGLTPLDAEAYRARRRDAEALAAALTVIATVRGGAYEYRPGTWFRC